MKKPLHERIAIAKERQAKLAARLAAMEGKQKATDRKLDVRRKIVIGAAVLGEMERSPAFAASMRALLAKAVTRPQDRDAIADLLPTQQAAANTDSPEVETPEQNAG